MHHSEVLVNAIRRNLSSPPTQGVEVGVQSGRTSEALLRAFPRLTLWLVDPWSVPDETDPFTLSGDPTAQTTSMEWEQVYSKCRERLKFAANRSVFVRSASQDAVAQFPDASLGFAFIDASHAYESVLSDFRAWWPKISSGGIIAGHDYGNTAPWTVGVKPAIDLFAAENGLQVHAEPKSVAWMRKI